MGRESSNSTWNLIELYNVISTAPEKLCWHWGEEGSIQEVMRNDATFLSGVSNKPAKAN